MGLGLNEVGVNEVGAQWGKWEGYTVIAGSRVEYSSDGDKNILAEMLIPQRLFRFHDVIVCV